MARLGPAIHAFLPLVIEARRGCPQQVRAWRRI